MRILISEDDENSIMYLSELLMEYGECDVVKDGVEAVDAFSKAMNDKKNYDLVWLDIMLPRLDGVKVLKAIRDLEVRHGILPAKRAKIVMVTALGMADFVEAAYENGCNAYLPKPFFADKFLEVIRGLEIKNNQ